MRLLQREPQFRQETREVHYLSIEAAEGTVLWRIDAAKDAWPSYAPIYMTAIRTTTQHNSPLDLWGHVKIPDIESLPLYSQLSADEWITLDYGTNITYSSLIGLPIAGIPSSGNASFDIATRYSKLACDAPSYVRVASGNWAKTIGAENSTYISSFRMQMVEGTNFRLFGTYKFQFDSVTNGSFPISYTSINCTVLPRNVLSNVQCVDSGCRVHSMKMIEKLGSRRFGPDHLLFCIHSLTPPLGPLQGRVLLEHLWGAR